MLVKVQLNNKEAFSCVEPNGIEYWSLGQNWSHVRVVIYIYKPQIQVKVQQLNRAESRVNCYSLELVCA